MGEEVKQKDSAAGASEPFQATRYDLTSWFARLFFGYVNPLLSRAAESPLEEFDAEWLPPPGDMAEALGADFERMYGKVKAEYGYDALGGSPSSSPSRSSRSKDADAGGGGRKGAAAAAAPPRRKKPWTTLTGITLLRLYWWPMLHESLWVLAEVGQRLGTPVALREFLRWLQAYDAGEDPTEWKGWLWAVVLGLCGLSMMLIHHQLFWIGMRAGFTMRQQCVAAVHAKVLRLNSASVSAVSSGHVVNLVSNDVRRFDDVLPFWIFLWAAPLELALVLLMVSLELDFVSALAGVATSLAMIPIQSALVRYIGGLRRNTARCTDERVRLAGEVVEGALAMKMLSWEDPFTSALRSIRGRETAYSRRMQRIRAVNFGMQFCITPIVSFVTFAVYRARNGTLNTASVFYALSLLHLPKLYMVNFFVLAVQTLTELRVSLQRIDAFLSTPEPPRPHATAEQQQQQQQQQEAEGRVEVGGGGKGAGAAGEKPLGYVSMGGADYDWLRPFGRDDVRVTDTHGTALGGGGGDVSARGKKAAAAAAGGAAGNGGSKAAAGGGSSFKQSVAAAAPATDAAAAATAAAATGGDAQVEAPKADARQAEAVGREEGQAAETVAAAAAERAGSSSSSASGAASTAGGADGEVRSGESLTLAGVAFECAPGELLGICGAVGCGKSSLLAALLGELQPLERPLAAAVDAAATADTAVTAATAATAAAAAAGGGDAGPVVRGRVAYCAQVPWIMAGSVRDNIVFGASWEPDWYSAVVAACCLADDLAGLPAGDQTELGERGINLSGGQKARVALARACYCRPHVALLDDPLSAVDPRVGRHLFDRALGPRGLLAGCGTTRLLVTHQRQYLPKCDRVMVLRGGRVLALAGWREVAALRLPELTAGQGGLAAAGPAGGGGGGGAAEEGGGEEPLEDGPTVDEVLDQEAAGLGGGKAAAGAAEQAVVSGGSSGSSSSTAAAAGGVAAGVVAVEMVEAAEAAEAVVLELADEGAADVAAKGAAAAAAVNGTTEAAETPTAAAANSQYGANGAANRGSFMDRYRLSMSRTFVAGRANGAGGAAAGGGGIGRSGTLGRMANSALWLRQQISMALSGGGGGNGIVTVSKSTSLTRVDTGKLVASEDKATGTVSWAVYGRYCRHMGLGATAFIVAGMLAGQGVFLASEWWLALWSRADAGDQGNDEWLWVYGLLTGIVIVIAFLRSFVFFESNLNAATSIHNLMAKRVLRAPLSFFHTNPSGRIVNRFSKDQGQVDDLLPSCAYDALQSSMLVAGAFVLVSIAVPVILPVFLPLALAFHLIRARYITASREIKRWEAITRSPVFASFSATLKGLPTIRAYGAATRFHDDFLHSMSHNGNWYFAFISTSRWIGVRLDGVAGTTLLAAALLAMAMRSRVNTGVLALALTHVLQLTGVMQWVVRQSAEVENNMTSVERMLAYTQLDSEPPRLAEGGAAPPEGWPRSGALEYEDVTAVYRPGLPPVLRGISFRLAPGTSCGVVGRTGSGKSSLMLTLFRLIDVSGGRILLDGQDTAGLALDALRRQLAIIPQDPVLFSGTLRSNLDPWRGHNDGALWGVLEAVQLKGAVAAMPGGLDSPMSECGGNLSVGQRQLFCLARALLQDARVLALDEATANVDRATDELIQSALRDFAHRDREQHGRVLLVIAHRIDTILDCDQLLVLAAGQLVEAGPPAALAAGSGVFSKMVAAAKLGGGGGAAAAVAH
ncbi:hypothetical protein HYH02_014893 [Chlamydomonas schloesseri]|uniref:Uncharacterized protein n=1 Tax=Chlamydomonas schloesseri TaxID=2026947 RepID=A0A835VS90_9CHLO|nr:hypothetical protein HYH02_014893 [Chlamydomonas schloesseri]|eukprot:KAG2425890.1 hypothetical protein HYH02_014893 [Chlamydomonas schloesseri]